MTDLRTETDSLGRKQLPREAVWGIHIARALENFPITGVPLAHFPELVRALAMVKKAAALANRDLGALDPDLLLHEPQRRLGVDATLDVEQLVGHAEPVEDGHVLTGAVELLLLAEELEQALRRLAETRQILQLYDRWFLDRLPSGERLGRPMTPQLEEIFHTIGLPEE